MAISQAVESPSRLPREYETIYILRPMTSTADAEKVSHRVTEVVERFGGKLTRVDNWGKRRLAYPMKNHSRGVFVYVRYVAIGDVVVELERNLRILDPVIRFMTVQVRDEVDVAALEVDPEEVAFHHVEGEEEEEEENLEERLGLAPPRAQRGDEGQDDDRGGDTRSATGSDDEGDTDASKGADDAEAKGSDDAEAKSAEGADAKASDDAQKTPAAGSDDEEGAK